MSESIYRVITEDEYPRFAQISGDAFNYTPDLTPTREGLERSRGLFVDGTMVARLGINPFRMQTGGHEVACIGLGGVATPPEQRRRGHVGALLRAVCDEARANNTYFCMLHPFKESFYGHYGWATAMERRIYTGAPTLLSSFRQTEGDFIRIGLEAFEELNHIYTHGLRGRYGLFMRNQDSWKHVLANHGRPRYSYIWRDANGAGRAYLIYELEPTPNGLRMACREVVALDPLARSQLFAFMANLDSQCAEVRFTAPADAPVNLLMPNPLTCEVEFWGMLRLLDIPSALTGYSGPRDVSGRAVIAVSDDWLDHNNGTFALEIADGRVNCAPTSDQPDVTIDVRVLTQLMTRYLRPRTAAAFGMLAVHSRPALALLDAVFAGLAPFNVDFY